MSTLKVDTIDNGSKIDFPNGFNVGGNPVSQGYTSSGTAPDSPSTGDFWYNTTDKSLFQYANGSFKKLPTQPAKYYPRNYKYVSTQKISVSGYDSGPRLLTIGSDNKTVVISGTSGDDLEIGKLATARDMSTLPATPNVGNDGWIQNFDTTPNGGYFSPDGDYFFAVGGATDDIDRWSLPTAFSFLSASNDQTNTTAVTTNPAAIYFKPDGTKVFITDQSERIYQGTLSTAWDVSTSSLTMDTNYANFQTNQANEITRGYSLTHYGGFWISDDGLYCCVLTNRGGRGGALNWGVLSTAWDITTVTFDPADARPILQDEVQNPYDFAFTSDGSHLYILDATTDNVVYMEWEAL
jgi:hypothetical protein